MKTTTFCVLGLTAGAMALAPYQAAQAATCTISVTERVINGGVETGGGVPNYAQGSFEPGTNDCSPTAIGMVLGFWDANGWPCLMPGTDPYTGGSTPHASIDATVEHFKSVLSYSSSSGTLHTPFHAWGSRVLSWVTGRDGGASGWHVPDDFYVTHWDITSEIDAGRPLVFSGFGLPGKRITWNSPSGSSVSNGGINHSMTALGYRRVVEGDDIFGGCNDWLDHDEFYVVNRSGWVNGGNSRVYYHWEIWALKSVLKVEPRGSASCCATRNDGTCEEAGGGGSCAAGTDHFDCGYCLWPNDGECDEASGTGLCPAGSDAADCGCPWPNDNECDEPEGTNLCAEGTDVNDCYCPWPGDGECDEPEGTNLCPEGSDSADC